MEIDSELGQGTTLIPDIPFADDAIATFAAPAGESGRATILVAEDDDGTRAVLTRILERLGHAVLLATDGLQALRLAESHAGPIDLLLTDVIMPRLTGPQLAARLQAVRPGIPVLFMPGYPEDALSEVPGLQVETDLVAKPFTYAGRAEGS